MNYEKENHSNTNMKDEVLERLRETINRELEKKNVGYTVFADLCGVSRRIMADIVNGKKTDIKLSTIVKICENSSICLSDIFTETNDFSLDSLFLLCGSRKFRIELMRL